MTDTITVDEQFVAAWKTIAPLLPVDKTVTHINGPALLVVKLKSLDDPTVVSFMVPSNERFWRKMVLATFDFTVSADNTFNVSNECDLEESDGENRVVAQAMREYEREFGRHDEYEFLVEDLHWWLNLGIYFRPSQYSFLHRIQSGEATIETAWPASEDAYTLFHELAMVKQVFGDMEGELTTFSDGEQPVSPVLLSKMDTAIRGRGFPLLKHCGFTPHFWECIDDPVSEMWSGFDSNREPDANVDDADEDGEDSEDSDDGELFPLGEDDIVDEIKQTVLEWCSDWRHVHINPDEYQSPAFYVGKSKKSTRWLGFVGQRDC